jgi:general stress protein 26
VKDTAEVAAQVRALMSSQRYAVLSTHQDDGHPYASLVAFSVSDDLAQLVFCTLRSTRKFANLVADGRIALLVDNRSNDEADLQTAAAVTLLGRCEQVERPRRDQLAESFLRQHPAMNAFLESPGCAVILVNVQAYYLVTRFQNVVELHIDSAAADGDDGQD